MKSLKNPFVYGKEVSGGEFCNRKKEITALLEDIRSGQNVIIYSPRRYGKTSLIKEVLRIAEKENIRCVYVDLYAILKEEDFVSSYADAIARSLVGPIEKILDTLRGLFKTLRPRVTITPQGETEFGVELTRDVNLMIEDVAQAVKKYSEKIKRSVVVVFDEFQQIGLLGSDRLERKLRGIFQTHGRDITYIFMGSKKHLLYNMFSNANRPFYKMGRHLPLSKIEEEDLTMFILKRFKFSGKGISGDNAKRIVEIAECHPYYVQHLSSSVWKLADKTVTESIIVEALKNTIAEEKSAYTNLWDELSINQKKILLMIAEIGRDGKIYSKEVLQKYAVTPTTVQKTTKSLIEKDIIDKTNGSYEISDVFFRLWLLQIMSRKL